MVSWVSLHLIKRYFFSLFEDKEIISTVLTSFEQSCPVEWDAIYVLVFAEGFAVNVVVVVAVHALAVRTT